MYVCMYVYMRCMGIKLIISIDIYFLKIEDEFFMFTNTLFHNERGA